MSVDNSDMEVDQSVPFVSEEEKKVLFDKMNKCYWQLEDDKVKYQQLTGEEFVPTLEGMYEDDDDSTTKKQHNYFSVGYERQAKQVDESKLLPDEKCIACSSLLPKKHGEVCSACYRLTRRNLTKVSVCDAPPQLKNDHQILWNSQTILYGCKRCKLVRMGVTEKIDYTSPPPCTQIGGYARLQDLSSLDLSDLFPDDSPATTGAVIVRVMDFSVENERVLGNFLVKFSKNDSRIKDAYYFSQIVRREVTRGAARHNIKKKSKSGLVKVQERLISWSIDEWTPDAACEINSFCFADMLVTPLLNDKKPTPESPTSQRIQTRIINLGFTISLDYKYASLSSLDFHLLNRGAIMTWTLSSSRRPSWPQPDTQLGCVYMYGIELEDAIYVYIGNSKNDARYHYNKTKTSLVLFENAHPKAKKFKTELYYGQKMSTSSVSKPKSTTKDDRKPQKVQNDSTVTRAESKFIHAFLLAHLNDWSFKHFTPSYPLTTKKDKYWPDLTFGDDSLDKPIRLINRMIPGENYTKPELDELFEIPAVLFNADIHLHYDWDLDPLKY